MHFGGRYVCPKGRFLTVHLDVPLATSIRGLEKEEEQGRGEDGRPILT